MQFESKMNLYTGNNNSIELACFCGASCTFGCAFQCLGICGKSCGSACQTGNVCNNYSCL